MTHPLMHVLALLKTPSLLLAWGSSIALTSLGSFLLSPQLGLAGIAWHLLFIASMPFFPISHNRYQTDGVLPNGAHLCVIWIGASLAILAGHSLAVWQDLFLPEAWGCAFLVLFLLQAYLKTFEDSVWFFASIAGIGLAFTALYGFVYLLLDHPFLDQDLFLQTAQWIAYSSISLGLACLVMSMRFPLAWLSTPFSHAAAGASIGLLFPTDHTWWMVGALAGLCLGVLRLLLSDHLKLILVRQALRPITPAMLDTIHGHCLLLLKEADATHPGARLLIEAIPQRDYTDHGSLYPKLTDHMPQAYQRLQETRAYLTKCLDGHYVPTKMEVDKPFPTSAHDWMVLLQNPAS